MNQNEFFQALPITRLKLRLTSADIEICTDDIEDIHVMVSGSRAENIRITAAANTLKLEQPLGYHPQLHGRSARPQYGQLKDTELRDRVYEGMHRLRR